MSVSPVPWRPPGVGLAWRQPPRGRPTAGARLVTGEMGGSNYSGREGGFRGEGRQPLPPKHK